MEYTPRYRFWIIVVPLFLLIIATGLFLYQVGTATTAYLRSAREFGDVAAWALALTIALAGVNFILRRYGRIKEKLGRHGERLKPEYQGWLIRRKQLIIDVHLAVGIIGFLAALIHAQVLWQYRNTWLITTMLLFAYIILGGLTLKLSGIPPTARRYAYLLHSQWITVALLIIVVLVGHAVL